MLINFNFDLLVRLSDTDGNHTAVFHHDSFQHGLSADAGIMLHFLLGHIHP